MDGESKSRRHRDAGTRLDELTALPCLVVCPRCEGCAVVRLEAPGAAAVWQAERRLTCPGCGLVRRWTQEMAEAALAQAAPPALETQEPHFGVDWWLQTPCRGRVLWACHAQHLQRLKEHTAALLRERRRDAETGWANGSLLARLPRWMQQARHREDVLAGIARLEARLAEGGMVG